MKIDIVVPWVDGNDPKWIEEKSKYAPCKGTDARVNRYRDWDLMRYWFRGIEKYMPWINRIHFVTWGHIPQWLDTSNPKLNIVNHKDYIPGDVLPVFSSHPIELNMHRIDGLAEHFIYFNDDMFVVRPMKQEEFFVGGLPVDAVTEVPLRFNPGGIDSIIGNDMMVINKNFNKSDVIKKNKKLWFSVKNLKATLKNLYMKPVNGFSAFDNPHLPQPFLKSTFEELWEKEEELLRDTTSHRFRSNDDVNQWLFRYWQFASGRFVQGKGNKGRFFSIGRDNELIEKAIKNKEYAMVCLSDDDVNLDFEAEKKRLIELFQSVLPDKSGFEK